MNENGRFIPLSEIQAMAHDYLRRSEDDMESAIIIGDLERWLAGEPVPSHAEIIERWGREFLHYSHAGVEYPSQRRMSVQFCLRLEVIQRFGFAIPCREVLDLLAKHQPIVEVGAGTGFMTMLMRHRGIAVTGTDPGTETHLFNAGCHDPSQLRIVGKAAVRRFRDCTVFCSWPSLNRVWFREALRAMRVGQRAVIIEEGCCAERSTWHYRSECFELEASALMPTWPFMNDRCAVWVKKQQTGAPFVPSKWD